MKTKWIVTAIAGFLMHTAVIAQERPGLVPEWASAKGWWVVETATRSPKQQIVYFYNREGVLVYKEKLDGIRLNPEKRKTKMHLKQALEAAVVGWEKEGLVKEGGSLVLSCLKGK
jgi:hypothetical protein